MPCPHRSIRVSCLAAVLAATAASVAADGPGGIVESATFTGRVESGGRVTVTNFHGDVRVRQAGPTSDLEMLSVRQRPSVDAPGLEVAARETPAGIEIVVEPPSPEGGAVPPRLRADLTLFVPEGASLRVRTGGGLVEVKGFQGDVDVATEDGRVVLLGGFRTVNAETGQGSVLARFDPWSSAGPKVLRSRVGDVTAWVPAEADLDAAAATSGEISSDFSMEIEHHDAAEPSKRATARIGEGGQRLELASRQGHVSLFRLPPKSMSHERVDGEARRPADED